MTAAEGADSPDLAAPAAAGARPPSPFVALALSLFVPGAGHLYARRWLAGVVWLVIAFAAYAWRLGPGLVVHGLCMLSAAFIGRTPTTARGSIPSGGAARGAR
jgi:hypothetical protein